MSEQHDRDESKALPVRHSVRELQSMYDQGDKEPLENLLRAWAGIKALPPDDLNSFFVISGYHGEPFVGQGAISDQYWGGYCNHGNVLFPTWHRVYVLRIEQALQSIVPGVMMPYWDETSEETLLRGIPSILTDETVELDGQRIDNPLRSYVLQKQVDDAKDDGRRYTKPAGYETVRYPLSGLVGTPQDRELTQAHNAKFPDAEKNVELLNQNVLAWLAGDDPTPSNPHPTSKGIFWQFRRCLDAPNYTAFSNTTSATAWTASHPGPTTIPLEAPHNDVHLAVGGFDLPGQEIGQIAGANGDMGENNTAGLDPIFFFHHCNVDRMFWLWQVKNGHEDAIDIIPGFPGTSPNTLPGGQGPAAGQDPNQPLSMDTPLKPFLLDASDVDRYYTSRDCINIETQLGFTYSHGSLAADATAKRALVDFSTPTKKLKVSGIDRATIPGSFVVHAKAEIDGTTVDLGRDSVLSRWNVANCVNCQSHLKVTSFFDLDGLTDEQIERAQFSVEVQHRGTDTPEGAASVQLEVVVDDTEVDDPPLTPRLEALITRLRVLASNPVVEAAFNEAIAHVVPMVEGDKPNPWVGKTIDDFVAYFASWGTWLPTPVGGLGKIEPFTYFYLNNPSAFFFLNNFKSKSGDAQVYSREIFDWTVEFILARGEFMDSPASLEHIKAWLDDPAIQIDDFIVPEGGFASFNAFFTRELDPAKNARPIASPDDDGVLVASADSEINFIISDLTLETPLEVKTRQLNVKQLLDGSSYAERFEGGTAVSCVLMPNNYHRYHAPVTGQIVESKEVAGIYNGVMDGEHWFNTGNIGESTTDFSIFEDFHRAYFVFETNGYGCVAMVPVGLNTISAIFASMVNHRSTMVPPGSPPVPVRKGQELGHFAYGGSLNILLFEPGVYSSVSVLMGQRIGTLSRKV